MRHLILPTISCFNEAYIWPYFSLKFQRALQNFSDMTTMSVDLGSSVCAGGEKDPAKN
jgi:hypothetical protein